MPAILLPGIGSGQSPSRALHRIAQAMQQLADMSGMVLHTELLFDHPGDHRRGPHSAIQSVGHRTTVENVSELFSLPLRQHRRPTGPVALEQTLDPMSLIARQPLGNPGAWRFENFRQFATGPTFGIQNYGLHPFRHAIGTIPLRFLAQDNQSLIRLRMQSQYARNHGYTSARSMPHLLYYVLLLMRTHIIVAQLSCLRRACRE